MKKKFVKIAGIALAAVLATAFVACEDTSSYSYTSYSYFNTTTKWVFQNQSDATDPATTWQKIKDTLSRVEKSISVSVEGSAVSKFNAADAGAELEIDETAYNVFLCAKEIYEKTGGAYNPAVGNLIDLWGFSPRFTSGAYEPRLAYDRENPRTELPNETYIEAFTSLTDFSEVTLGSRDGKYYVQKPDCSVTVGEDTYTMQINLGGIGKGYAVDEAEAVIRAAGYEYGYFNLGGSSMSMLQKPDEELWQIGVVNPRADLYNGSHYMIVSEKDICLSSSGDYEQYYTIEGTRYSHIINPETGYPVNAEPEHSGGIICASVFGLSAASGDATTTALMVMGKDRAIEYVRENLSGVHVCFVYQNAEGKYILYTNMDESQYTLFAEMEIEHI